MSNRLFMGLNVLKDTLLLFNGLKVGLFKI